MGPSCRVLLAFLAAMAGLISAPAVASRTLPSSQRVSTKDAIVFINLNYSSKELQAVKKLSRETGRPLYVIPDEKLIPLADELQAVATPIIEMIKQKNPGWSDGRARFLIEDIVDDPKAPELQSQFPPSARPFLAKWAEKSQGLRAKEKELFSVSYLLDDAAQKIKASGQRVGTLVVSAHSSGLGFNSETSLSLNREAIEDLKRGPAGAILSEPTEVLLMGCYTNTDFANEHWKQVFPKAEMIAGFHGRGPLRTRDVSAQYIQQVLTTKWKLDRDRGAGKKVTPADVQGIFGKLSSIKATTASVAYCNVMVRSGAAPNCKEQWKIFQGSATAFWSQYFSWGEKIQDPPHETSGTALANFYNLVQGLCKATPEMLAAEPMVEILLSDRDRIREAALRLRFWWTVQQNFGRNYKTWILASENILKELGHPFEFPKFDGDLKWSEFRKKYKEFDETLSKANRELSRRVNESGAVPSPEMQHLMTRFSILNHIQVRLTDLATMKSSIPQGWIEPGVVAGSEPLPERGAP